LTSVTPESWPAPELPERPERPEPPAPTGADAWPAWAAPLALVAGLIGATVGGLLVFVITEAFGVDAGEKPPGLLLGATLVQDIAFVAAAIVFAKMTGPVWAAQFGLRPTQFWKAAGLIVATYLAFVLFAGLWTSIVGDPGDEPLLDDLGVDESTLLLVLGALTVCVGAPLVEEFFFRGFFFRALRNWIGVAGGAIATGIVFGGIHASSSPVEHLVPLAVLGALFCLLYQATGSLYPCIVLHAINNSIAFGVAKEWGWEIVPLTVASVAVCTALAVGVAARWSPAAR
jgi:uncharacterized protein